MHHIRSLRGIVLLALLTLLIAVGPHTSAETMGYVWNIQEVDPSGGYGTSLVLDGDGWPHMATGGGGVRYAYQDAGGWHSELVEGGDYGSAALVLAADGTPHISYQAQEQAPATGLKYAHKNGMGWLVEEVDVKPSWWASQIGFGSSIALGSDGYPRIAYMYEDMGDAWELRYACRDAAGWHPTTLYSFSWPGYGATSLAIDADGYAHIVTYRAAPNFDMVYVYQDASGWHLERVDDAGQSSDMKLDGAGYPHIAYHDNEDRELRYAYKDVSGWHYQVVDSFGTTGYSPSLHLDEGVPHIAYRRVLYGGENLRYAHPEGSLWVSYLVDDGASVHEIHGRSPSIAVGEDSAVHIGYNYRDGYDENLMYAHGEPEPEPCAVQLAVAKFDDLDGNGAQNPSEPFMSWTFTMTVNGEDKIVRSPESGWYTTTLTEDDTWLVAEHATFGWEPTTSDSQSGTAGCLDISALFGNTYIGVDLYLPLLMRG